MNKAIIGRKLGMTQVFTPEGVVIPVTVVEAGPCPVVQVKTVEKDGYKALQVGFGAKKEKNVTKPEKGHFKKANVEPTKYLKELRLDNAEQYEVGSVIKCDVFAEGDIVDVTGTTKGHGFSGVIKRWNAQRVGSMSHGTGPIHRSVGSMGANSDPSRVFKGKKMAGQYGNEQVTIQNLTVAKVDTERNVLLIKGGIPGAKGSLVIIRNAVKG